MACRLLFVRINYTLFYCFITDVIDPPQEIQYIAESEDDGQADIGFVIQERQSAPGSDTPDTGDRNQTILWIVLMALALCVVTGMVTLSLCKKNR